MSENKYIVTTRDTLQYLRLFAATSDMTNSNIVIADKLTDVTLFRGINNNKTNGLNQKKITYI